MRPRRFLLSPSPFAHPDALRRIRLIADQEELEQALAFPWEKWGVFLHPSQRALVERSFSGPARVAGSAGTGKTIVAIHRAVRLDRESPNARVLLASFSDPLAAELAKKVLVLAPETGGIVPRITTASFHGIAEQMFSSSTACSPTSPATQCCASGCARRPRRGLKGFSEQFLLSEWTNVIDAWGLTSLDAYSTVERIGRKSRLGPNQRARLWPVFQAAREALAAERCTTWANVFTELADALARRPTKPFDHVVVDVAADLAPAELRVFAALAPAKADGLFLSGDVGQRICNIRFRGRASASTCGAARIRSRSATVPRSRFAAPRISCCQRCCATPTGWRTSGAGSFRSSTVRRLRCGPSNLGRAERRQAQDRREPGSARDSASEKLAYSSGRHSSSPAPEPPSPALQARPR